MLPSCRLLVYYVRDEEVVADETKFGVLNEFQNQVSMKFDEKVLRPGSSVKLTVKGAPSSRIAVAAVDKSIHFLAKGNDVKVKELVAIREKSTISPGYVSNSNRCVSSGWAYRASSNFVDSEKAFANVGSVILTSLRADLRPCGELIYEMMDTRTMEYGDYSTTGDRLGCPNCDMDEALPSVAKTSKKVEKKKKKKKNSARPRTDFPETWLWTDEILSSNGTRVFNVKVPDSITTWYASGFGISKSAGLGIANPTELRAFQPFFVSLTLPYSVVRGEDVTIPAAVFSYLEGSCMAVKVSIRKSRDYDMATGRHAKACLCSGRTATVLFRIKPKTLGPINVRVSAQSLDDNICSAKDKFSSVDFSDIVVRKLLVEPEGIKDEYTQSSFFCSSNQENTAHTTDLNLRLPDNLVQGSLFGRVEVIGDVMGSSLSNVDELLAMPYGCGEQNMLKFAPNIFIMNYLNNSAKVDEEIRIKALDYMRTGYQRELTYKHTGWNNGAYSAFGDRDKTGSTWLTAFVLKSYAQAQSWIDVDKKEIDATANWLIKNQDKKSGCFPKIGDLHNKAMAGGVKTPATLTAYVIVSLLEAGFTHNSIPIKTASSCVEKVFSDMEVRSAVGQQMDSYSLSIMAYMFAKLKNRDFYKRTVKILDKIATNKDGMIHWTDVKEDKEESKSLPWYWRKPRSTDIEQTAYVLLAKLSWDGKQSISEVLPVVKWLSKQRNSLGGWSSTQDTVLAMQALAEFASLTFSSNANMEVQMSAENDFQHAFSINDDNKIVLQRVENLPVPSTLRVKAQGEGCALVQANVKYNVQKVLLQPKFQIDVFVYSVDEKLTRRKSCRSQILKVCASWLGEGKESNMAIIDVRMVSGFTADERQFEEILEGASTMDLKDIEVKEKSLVFYLRRIGKTSQCVKFRVDQTTDVKKAKQAPIQVYDYYDKDQTATVMYKFTKAQCCGDNNTRHSQCRPASRSRTRRELYSSPPLIHT